MKRSPTQSGHTHRFRECSNSPGSRRVAANTAIQVNGGRLKINASGAPNIGSGVTVTVASAGTLELAGTVSALSSAVKVTEATAIKRPAAALVVSGTNQQIGNLDGSGTTQINAGSDLTANHIIQSALVIGGTASSPALVNIDASDMSGNPLAESSGFSGALLSSLPRQRTIQIG